MRDAVIVEAVRTPVGKRNGGLSGVHPVDLSAHVLQRAGASAPASIPALVDDVIWGCVGQVGEQTFDIARTAVLAAGWPETVPGVTDRPPVRVLAAVGALRRGRADRRPVRRRRRGRRRVDVPGADGLARRRAAAARSRQAVPRPRYGGVFPNQGIGAEMIAEHWGLSRTAARRVLASPRTRRPRAARTRAGSTRRSRRSRWPTARSSASDEGIRRGGTVEKLAQPEDRVQARGRRDHRRQLLADLRRLGRAADDDRRRRPRELGLTPIARVHTAVLAGDDPVIMLTAPIPATQKALQRSRAAHRRDRRLRGQRGVRLGAAGLAGRDRRRRQGAQPERRRDRARPPAGRLRRPADDDAGAPHARQRRSATACRPCARAAARPTPPSSSCC